MNVLISICLVWIIWNPIARSQETTESTINDAQQSSRPPLSEENRKPSLLRQEQEKFVGTWKATKQVRVSEKGPNHDLVFCFEIETGSLLTELAIDGCVHLFDTTLDLNQSPHRLTLNRKSPQNENTAARIGEYIFTISEDGTPQLEVKFADRHGSTTGSEDWSLALTRVVLKRLPKEDAFDMVKVNVGTASDMVPSLKHSLETSLMHSVRLDADAESNCILVPRHYRLTDQVRQLAERYVRFAYSDTNDHGRVNTQDPVLSHPSDQVVETETFRVHEGHAVSIAQSLQQLVPSGTILVEPDTSAHTVTITGTPAELRAVSGLLSHLAPTDKWIPELRMPQESASSSMAPDQPESELTQLRTAYETANQRAHDLASSLRSTREDHTGNPGRTENELRIEKCLQQKVALHFSDVTFTEILRDISKSQGINFVLEYSENNLERLSGDRRISLHVEDVTLGSALTLLLDQAGKLDYYIDDVYLRIIDGKKPKSLVPHADDNTDDIPTTKSELRTAVQRAFTLRQRLLRAELQEMQARLEETQKSLDMRDRMADQIVDRRVEDLLNPELWWNNKVPTK